MKMNKCKVIRLFKDKQLVTECKFDTMYITERELNHKDIVFSWMGIDELHIEYDQEVLANGVFHISNGIANGKQEFDSFEIGASHE